MPKRRRSKLNKSLKKKKVDHNLSEIDNAKNELATSSSMVKPASEMSDNIKSEDKTEAQLPSQTMDKLQQILTPSNLNITVNTVESSDCFNSPSDNSSINNSEISTSSLSKEADGFESVESPKTVEASSSFHPKLLQTEQSCTDLSKPSCSNNLSISSEEVTVIDDETEDVKPNITVGPSNNNNSASEDSKQSGSRNECPICLQSCVHPTRLPCSHLFCYICIKGIVLSRSNCPLCRSQIPYNYLNHPNLVPNLSPTNEGASQLNDESEKYFWFYEGKRGGWWQFEERMSDEIECRKNSGLSCFDMMICGSLYVIDTTRNIQYPKNNPCRIRRIIRDLPSGVHKKGIAGIYRHHLPMTM